MLPVPVSRERFILTRKPVNCECIATWGRPTPRQSFSSFITTPCQVWNSSTYPLPYHSVFAADALLYTVTFSFDLRPWTFTVYSLWRVESLYQIWTQLNNPRRSYCNFNILPNDLERATLKHIKGHKVKHWNRNNSSADCLIAFKFDTEFHHFSGDTMQMFKDKGQRSRSRGHRSGSHRKVMYQQQNAIIQQWIVWRHRTWHGVVIKAGKGWRSSGGLKLQWIRNCHVF